GHGGGLSWALIYLTDQDRSAIILGCQKHQREARNGRSAISSRFQPRYICDLPKYKSLLRYPGLTFRGGHTRISTRQDSDVSRDREVKNRLRPVVNRPPAPNQNLPHVRSLFAESLTSD